MSDLSLVAEETTRRALAYWAERWDWESSVLFGIRQEEFRAVLLAWPNIPRDDKNSTSLAVVGAYRELLHGASAVARTKIQSAIGVTYEQACELADQVSMFVEAHGSKAANEA